MKTVHVRDATGQLLAACHPARARQLIKAERAVSVQRPDFVGIELLAVPKACAQHKTVPGATNVQ